ncbi:unnamed protein product [Caenorhabditis angaria]|uniref:7TM GPCR serpentine receptor class x (Srx) domain-containing protein n=1 Tax=Caenorhabditis angaria TaxID=860376 RepID=A0A9P1IZV6_9PELO|nr:unnamed protein product [Caenorhabditis angaria]
MILIAFMINEYPNYIHIQYLYGIYIFANPIIIKYSVIFLGVLYSIGTLIYVFLGYQIFSKVKSQQNKMSRSQKNYQKRVFVELTVQTLLKICSICIYGLWWIVLYILAPIGNVTYITIFCHCTFVGGSIPGAIYMIWKHPTYLKNFKKMIVCKNVLNTDRIFIRSSVIQ